uniref:TAP42-like protein n=1 Tax=Setaria digitata TaxID=48799 RepID=A0A915Q6G7_9BILA
MRGLVCELREVRDAKMISIIMIGSERSDISLQHEFKFCEDIIKQLESGRRSTKDLQEQLKQCEEKLKLLTKEVSARSLFGSNESVDELPTSSLNYLFLPYYLATVTQNVIVGPNERLSSLDRAKIYLQDFLERLKSYNIIDFDFFETYEVNGKKEIGKSKHDIDPSRQRELKLRQFQQEKELIELVENSESELHSNGDDDSLVRELILNRLHLAAIKSVNELRRIEEERPLAEHMLKIQTGQAEAFSERAVRQSGQTPFIVTRDALQKKVFGLGYPSIPTMTVNEWYDDMMKNGRFGVINPGSSENKSDSSDVDEEIGEERERIRLQKWDEYKDYHRRGWGNMHNKG